jgi:hypothetical protein
MYIVENLPTLLKNNSKNSNNGNMIKNSVFKNIENNKIL